MSLSYYVLICRELRMRTLFSNANSRHSSTVRVVCEKTGSPIKIMIINNIALIFS